MAEYPIHDSKYFDVREFVDEATWKTLGIRAQWLVDPKIVRVVDLLREKTGVPGYINTWHLSKTPFHIRFKSSGYRRRKDTTGAEYSQHRFGRATDYKAPGFTPAMLLHVINSSAAEFEAAGLTRMEDIKFTPTWLHMDCAPKIKGVNPESGFYIFAPK